MTHEWIVAELDREGKSNEKTGVKGGAARATGAGAFNNGSCHEPVLKGGSFLLHGPRWYAPPFNTGVKAHFQAQPKASFPLVSAGQVLLEIHESSHSI